MSFQTICGNCEGTHGSTEEVRACYDRGPAVSTGPMRQEPAGGAAPGGEQMTICGNCGNLGTLGQIRACYEGAEASEAAPGASVATMGGTPVLVTQPAAGDDDLFTAEKPTGRKK